MVDREWAEPLEDEDSADWEAFRCFRDLPPRERTVADVARMLRLDVGTLRRKAREFDWERRALAYDAHLDGIRRERRERAERLRGDLAAEKLEIGMIFVDAGKARAEQLARNPTDIAPRDAVLLVERGLSMITGEAAGQAGQGSEIERALETLEDDDLVTLLALLNKAKLAAEE